MAEVRSVEDAWDKIGSTLAELGEFCWDREGVEDVP